MTWMLGICVLPAFDELFTKFGSGLDKVPLHVATHQILHSDENVQTSKEVCVDSNVGFGTETIHVMCFKQSAACRSV